MNRRSFLRWLGIGVPAAAVVVPALGTTVPETASAKIGEWNNFYSEGDPELMEAIENWKSYPVHHMTTLLYDKEFVANLKVQNTVFDAIASRRAIPVNVGVKREFFQYSVKS